MLLISILGWGLSMYLASQYAPNESKNNRRALLYTISIESELAEAATLQEKWQALTDPLSKYPPLFYISALLARAITWTEDDRLASLSMMLAFFLALSFGFYLLLRVKLNSDWAILGTALFCTAPGILVLARVFSPTFPCMALLALALGIAAKTEPFKRVPATLALAVVCGAGLMFYYSMLVFLIGPVLFSFILALRENPSRYLRVLALSVMFLLVAALICAPYYLSDDFIQWAYARFEIFFIPEGETEGQDYALPLRALYVFFDYSVRLLKTLWESEFPILLLFVVLGRRKLKPNFNGWMLWLRPNHVGGMLASTLLISLSFFSLYGTKNIDYVMPLYPVFAYPFCAALSGEFFSKRRALTVGLAVFAMILGVSVTLISFPRFPQRMVDEVIDPLVQECRGADPPCIVAAYYCNDFTNVLLQVNRGWDPERMLIKNPPAPENGGPPAERIDFILIEKKRGAVGKPDAGLKPFNQPCAVIPEYDLQTGEVIRLTHYGRDVTDLFEIRSRADGSDKSLILYRRKDRRNRLPGEE